MLSKEAMEIFTGRKSRHSWISFFRKKSGFTIIEAMVVVGISIGLASIFVIYNRNSETQIVFYKEQAVLVNTLLRAKAFAVETFQPALQQGINQSPERVCGWGVHFEKGAGQNRQDQYLIFRDLMPSGFFDCKVYASGNYNDLGETFQKFNLDPRIAIKCLTFSSAAVNNCNIGSSGGALSFSDVDVLFIPPDPKVVFSRGGPGDRQLYIVLASTDGNFESVIEVNKSGQVNFQ